MSYQGCAMGTLYAECITPNIVDKVVKFLEHHDKLTYWIPRIEAEDHTIKLIFDGEIRYYFTDYISEVDKDLMNEFPGTYMHGALYMRAENDCPYRWEIHRDGATSVSDDIDWLMDYTCDDIVKIREWAEKHCTAKPIMFD